VFAGLSGTGKTTAASYLVATGQPVRMTGAWTRAESPRFLHAEGLFAAASLTAGSEADVEMRKNLERAQILAIDDLGLEKDPRKRFQPYLDWLFNARYSGAGWTVVTTNLPIDSFRQRYGERIYDRLRQRAEWFDLAGASMRGRP
jgi:DNA replication protein DnaC